MTLSSGLVLAIWLAAAAGWADDAASDPVISSGTGGMSAGGDGGDGAGAGTTEGGGGQICDADRCVQLYERVEETLTHDAVFDNPFTDTELRVTVSAPSGRPLGSSFDWYGFHDGDGGGNQLGNVWRFRLLFDYPGTWTVVAAFSEPGTDIVNGPSQQYAYQVASTPAAGEHGHVYVDPNNSLRLRHADGTPWAPAPPRNVAAARGASTDARQAQMKPEHSRAPQRSGAVARRHWHVACDSHGIDLCEIDMPRQSSLSRAIFATVAVVLSQPAAPAVAQQQPTSVPAEAASDDERRDRAYVYTPRPRFNNEAMMHVGSVLTMLGAAGLIVGNVVFFTMAADDHDYSGAVALMTAAPVLIGSVATLGVGIPLWAVGGAAPDPDDYEPQSGGLPKVRIGAGAVTARWCF